MDSPDTMPHVYRELADWYDRRAEPSMRDRFLVLAMDAAQRAGHPDEAERLRQCLLRINPHHLLRPFGSFTEATQAADVQTYLGDLRRHYPAEVAQVLLRSLRNNAHHRAPEGAPTVPVSHVNGDTVELPKLSPGQETAPTDRRLSAPQRTTLTPHRLEPEIALPVSKPAAKPSQPEAAPRPTTNPKTTSQPRGGWFGIILFVLLLLCGITLAGYVLARPFVPALVKVVRRSP